MWRKQMRGVAQHMVVHASGVERGRMAKSDSETIPEQAEQQRRQQDDPEPDQPTQQIIRPVPLVALNGSQHRATDEVSAQHEEENNCLVAGTGDSVGHQKQSAVLRKLRVIDQKDIAGVLKQHKQGCDDAQ